MEWVVGSVTFSGWFSHARRRWILRPHLYPSFSPTPIKTKTDPTQCDELCTTQNYPRGQRELLGPLTSAFGPKEAYECVGIWVGWIFRAPVVD